MSPSHLSTDGAYDQETENVDTGDIRLPSIRWEQFLDVWRVWIRYLPKHYVERGEPPVLLHPPVMQNIIGSISANPDLWEAGKKESGLSNLPWSEKK